eukprot:5313272-Prymnesium_polylepis.2
MRATRQAVGLTQPSPDRKTVARLSFDAVCARNACRLFQSSSAYRAGVATGQRSIRKNAVFRVV